MRIVLLALAIGLASPALFSAISGASTASAADGEQLYFEETGQILSGAFLDRWMEAGGVDHSGYPVTPPVQFGGRWVQWFEYTRMVLDGAPFEEATMEHVSLAPVGRFYAEKFGYTRGLSAFRPVEGAGEGARFFEESGHSVANGFLAAYERGSNAEQLGNPISQEFELAGKTYQFFEYGALSWTEAGGITFEPIGYLDALLEGRPVQRQEKPEGMTVYSPSVFSGRARYPGERWIDINLSTFTLTALEGDQVVMSSLIVTGASITPTVVGEFRINWKLESQTMEGAGPDGIEYIQEDVPWVMYFYRDWAIHGAYWRYSFGYAASHGCVNLPVSTAEWLYHWAPYGTRVSVHG